MSVVQDMFATYRGPHKVVARLLARGEREDRSLSILMAACGTVFIAQWPRIAREAHMTGQELNPMLGGALLGWIFIAPLIFYALAFISQILLRAFGQKLTGFSARIALFWAFLASAPLLLLRGLVAGFLGKGMGLSTVDLIWVVIFMWFWIAGLVQAGRGLG